MSREIKFRAWVKSENCYMGKWLDTQHPTIFSAVNEVAEFYGDEDLAVEQYTGLKDKNGKEIYEGDIVKGSWLYGKDEHIVKYEDYGFYPFTVTDFDGDPMIRNVDVEVIGNIHENKELLK